MTGTLTVMRSREREVFEWDTELVTSNGVFSAQDIKEVFAEKSAGAAAFATTEGGVREQIRGSEFNPEEQSEVTIIPAIAGGC